MRYRRKAIPVDAIRLPRRITISPPPGSPDDSPVVGEIGDYLVIGEHGETVAVLPAADFEERYEPASHAKGQAHPGGGESPSTGAPIRRRRRGRRKSAAPVTGRANGRGKGVHAGA